MKPSELIEAHTRGMVKRAEDLDAEAKTLLSQAEGIRQEIQYMNRLRSDMISLQEKA